MALAALGMARHASTTRKRILEHALRARIVVLVRETPGVLLSDLRRHLGCSAGTIQYHLRLLERIGMLESVQGSQRRHLFVAGVDPGTQQAYVILARHRRSLDFLQAILCEPEIDQRRLTERLSISRKALRDYVVDMQGCGLLDSDIVRGRRRYLPTPRLVGLLKKTNAEPLVQFPIQEKIPPAKAPSEADLDLLRLR